MLKYLHPYLRKNLHYYLPFTSLEAGESLKPHITPVDVFFFVLEGSPEILIGQESQIVEANSLIESPKDIPHCILNNSDNLVRVLVVKAPKPTTKTKLL